MQGITVAISPEGIDYFVEGLKSELETHLALLQPVDRTISVPNFSDNGGANYYQNISIGLSNGKMTGFSIVSQDVQQTDAKFQLTITSGSLSTQYTWKETYQEQDCHFNVGSGGWQCGDWYNNGNSFPYSPGVNGLTATINFHFQFDNNKWVLPVDSVTAQANVSANIPANSIVGSQSNEPCIGSAVTGTVSASLDAVDLSTPIQNSIGSCLTSIPASGQLTPDIIFAFGLGDSPLTFPNSKGLTVGVTGISTYKGQTYAGTPPTNLPVPAVPTDGHHLYMYVSDYVLNGLYWAFFMDGKLNTIVTSNTYPDDPDILKVKTYTSKIPSLKPYATRAMDAIVSAKAAPTVNFQTVYIFSASAMQNLQTLLPGNICNDISGLANNAYTSMADVESDLTASGVPNSNNYFSIIEGATRTMGAVVTHDIRFKMVIIDVPNHPGEEDPYFQFDVQRTDILPEASLVLGVSGQAQTLGFSFVEVSSSATFDSSNIPKFDGEDFAEAGWPNIGDTQYDTLQTDIGKAGVPLPIIQGFGFLFEGATLNIQQNDTCGFISILANVEFKS